MSAVRWDDIHYTYDDYKQWDGDWELIDGIPLAMSPAPMRKHQSISVKLSRLLDEQIDECKDCEVLSEVDYKILEDTIVRPDIVLTCGEQNEAYLTKTPEIIVEIISKSTAKRDEVYKFSLYEAEKVKYYILVYPDDLRAKIYKLSGKNYTKEGDFFTDIYTFKDTTCKIELDFSKVFKRYL